MELTIYDHSRKKIKSLSLDIFKDIKDVRFDIIHQVIVWQLSKRRDPIAHTKQISDVQGSTRKIYRQKGTGSARHGSNRRVQFRGGAVVFGPTNQRNFESKINKKQRKLALRHAFAHMLLNKSVLGFDSLAFKTHKTKDFLNFCKDIKEKKSLFVDDIFDKNFLLASRNIPNLKVVQSSGLNVKDIIDSEIIVISEAGVNSIVKRLK
jgi:large subunit ribosomal protein L4